MLTSGSPKATKEQSCEVEMCFAEVGDSVVGDFCLEFFRAMLLDE